MASYFQNTVTNLRSAMNTSRRYLIGRNQILPQQIESKSALPAAKNGIHLSAKQDYPQVEPLPLPSNIDPTESTRFSPQRSRDISSTAIATNLWNRINITMDNSSNYDLSPNSDPHIGSYDCTGAVSLNSSMQSNVPSPFGGMHKFTHLNMPGGQWEQSSKMMSHDLQASHYINLRREARKNWSSNDGSMRSTKNENNTSAHLPNKKGSCELNLNRFLHGSVSTWSLWPIKRTQSMKNNLLNAAYFACTNKNQNSLIYRTNVMLNLTIHRMYTADKKTTTPQQTDKNALKLDKADDKSMENVQNDDAKSLPVPLTAREKLKKAIKDYGITVIIFHVTISLVSLGFFYQLVSSGLDIVAILEYLGLGSTSSTISSNVTAGASTFVVAYAVHKVFAPFRISITLLSAPFIVRFLRKRGILAVKKSTKQL